MKVCFENIQYNFSSYNFWNSYRKHCLNLLSWIVLGVENISNFRLINSPCLFKLSGFCFSATPLVFLSWLLLLIREKVVEHFEMPWAADVILSAIAQPLN